MTISLDVISHARARVDSEDRVAIIECDDVAIADGLVMLPRLRSGAYPDDVAVAVVVPLNAERANVR